MKKCPYIALIILALWTGSFVSAQAPPWLYTNGIPVASPPPLVVKNSFYAPIRPLATSLGFEVGWDQTNLAALMAWEGNLLYVYADSPFVTVNGQLVELPKPTILDKGILYVPLRDFAECLGVAVNYSYKTNNVYLYSAWSEEQNARVTSANLQAVVTKEQSLIKVTMLNTSNITQHTIPVVRDGSGKLDFAAWIDLKDSKPLTLLRPKEEYNTLLGLPSWAYEAEFVEIIWVDSTRFRGRDPQSYSLLTLYVSLTGN